jgi:hypothetical protein
MSPGKNHAQLGPAPCELPLGERLGHLPQPLRFGALLADVLGLARGSQRLPGAKCGRGARQIWRGSWQQQLSTLTFRGLGNLSAQAYRERLDTLARVQEPMEGELSACERCPGEDAKPAAKLDRCASGLG